MMKFFVTLELGKETKGTHRYESSDEDAFVSVLYVKKAAFGKAAPPKKIQLSIVDSNE